MDGRVDAAPEGPAKVEEAPSEAPRDISGLVGRAAADRRRRVGLHGRASAAHLRVRRAAAVHVDAGGRGAAEHGRAGAARSCARARARRSRGWRAAPAPGCRGGALPVKDGVLLVLSRMKRILEIDLDNGRVCVEPGVTNANVSRRRRPGVLLPARPVVADRLLDRRQRGRELRRRALLQVRLHDELRHRAGDRARRRGDGSGRRLRARPARLRPAGRVRGLRGHARRGDQGLAAGRALARDGQDAGRVLRLHPRGRRGGLGDRPGRRRAGRDRDDGRARDRGLRADGPRGLEHARRRAAGRARRLRARVRGALRRGRRRSASAAAPTTSAWRATRPSASCSGRCARPPSRRWAASRPTTSSRTA